MVILEIALWLSVLKWDSQLAAKASKDLCSPPCTKVLGLNLASDLVRWAGGGIPTGSGGFAGGAMQIYGVQKHSAMRVLTWVLDVLHRFQAALNPTHDFSRRKKCGADGADAPCLLSGWIPSDGRRSSDGAESVRNSRHHTTDLLMRPLGGCGEKVQQRKPLGEQYIELNIVQGV